MKQITSRQASVLIFLSVIGLKAVLLPAIIYYYAGSGGYVSVFFSMGFDFLLLLVYLWIMKQNPNLKFFDIISQSFGKLFACIVMVFVFLYYFTKTLLLLVSTFNFFVQVLYDNMNWIFYLISTLFLLYFALKKNLRSFARVGEVLFWVVFVSINLVLIVTSIGMDLTNVLPFMQNGLSPVAKTSFRCAYAFGDYTIMIFIMGNIKYNNKTNSQIIGSSIMAISTILNFFIVFLCTFGYTVVNQNLAIADLSLYIDLAVSVSRLEWIAIFAWITTLVVQLTIYAFCTKQAFDLFVPRVVKKHSGLIIVGLLGLLYCIEELTINELINNFLTFPFATISVILQAGIPLLLVIAHILHIRRKRNNVRPYSQIA